MVLRKVMSFTCTKGRLPLLLSLCSSTAESMNTANKSVRSRTAVDPINAIIGIILLELESARYNCYRNEAWQWKEALTPHGKMLAENAFKNINQ